MPNKRVSTRVHNMQTRNARYPYKEKKMQMTPQNRDQTDHNLSGKYITVRTLVLERCIRQKNFNHFDSDF